MPDALSPDEESAREFFAALFAFPFEADERVHFRAVPEPRDSRAAINRHYALDADFPARLARFLAGCARGRRAAFFLPGLVKGHGTGKRDVAMLPALLADFDAGDPAANLAAAEAHLGPATLVVESGGVIEGRAKLHAYWCLTAPARGDDIERLCALRASLAARFGGDPAFKQAAQVIRAPGSIHFKAGARRVTLKIIRPEARYDLAELQNRLPPPAARGFDFNGALDQVLTRPIHQGGVDGITRFEAAGKAIGHFLRMAREGRFSPDEAWRAACDWNAANLAPPWSEARLRANFERLLRREIAQHGPFARAENESENPPDDPLETPRREPPSPASLPISSEITWRITDWRADRFLGPAPERHWLVDGVIPLGTAGVFAAVGDAGKSMMALELALRVACAPPRHTAPRFFGQSIAARGPAMVLTAEDDAPEIHRRLAALDPSAARAGKPLYIMPMLATGGARALLEETAGGPTPTAFWHALRDQLLALPDLKLIVLDPLSSFAGGDTNDNQLGSALMFLLGELASATGASVMLIHHFTKSIVPTGLTDARTAIRGAGALVDNGRWALAMWEAEEEKAREVLKSLGQGERARASGLVYFGGLTKGNAPGEKTLRTLVRARATGMLEDVTDALAATRPRADQVDDVVHRALCAHKRERPRWSFPISKNSVERHIMPVLSRQNIAISIRAAEQCVRRLLERGLIMECEAGATAPRYEPVDTA
jgi:hypothetical protein